MLLVRRSEPWLESLAAASRVVFAPLSWPQSVGWSVGFRCCRRWRRRLASRRGPGNRWVGRVRGTPRGCPGWLSGRRTRGGRDRPGRRAARHGPLVRAPGRRAQARHRRAPPGRRPHAQGGVVLHARARGAARAPLPRSPAPAGRQLRAALHAGRERRPVRGRPGPPAGGDRRRGRPHHGLGPGIVRQRLPALGRDRLRLEPGGRAGVARPAGCRRRGRHWVDSDGTILVCSEALVPLTAESVVIAMARPEGKKAMLLVMDGLGGYRTLERGSELTEARTPNLDRLAREGSLGLHDPVTRGITPGSGAGHLGLFGYDPLAYEIGRGALSAAGIGFELRPGDVAARVNFCNLAPDGTIADRRAGRLPTEEAARICELLMREVKLDGAELFLRPEREHRGLLVLRGDGLDPSVTDTDPQREGVPPLKPETTAPEAKRTAELIASLLDQARSLLAGRDRGNYLLVRGFDTHKELPSFPDRYKLRALAIATYPMYLGISRLLGFDTHQVEGAAPEEVDALERLSPEADFVFMHVKKTDSAGEDGDFERKVQAIEEVDALVPRMLDAGVEVLAVTGDHSTPAQMAAHSWHPVPVLLWGGTAAADGLPGFDEVNCRQGSLGRFEAKHLLPQLLAAAERLAKYGA